MPIHPDDDTGALEEARERLYSPSAPPAPARRALPKSPMNDIPHVWKSAPAPTARPHKHVRVALIFFIVAGGFFLLAAALAAFLLLSGANSVSTNNISIVTQGPTTIAGGDTVTLSISVANKNPVAVTDATLEVDFPTGTRSANDVSKNEPRYVEDLGTLTPGQVVSRQVKAVIFGGAGEALTLPVSLTYQTGGSSAVFVKQSSYSLAVSSAPLSVAIAAPDSAVSGQPYSLTLTVRSNATATLSGVVLALSYPFGFTVTSSSVPASGTNFVIGALKAGESRDITVSGVLVGQQNDERVFGASVGTATSPSDPTLAVTYMTQQQSVTLTAPFLAVTLTINGDTSNTPVVSAGSNVTANVSWQNTLTTPIDNAQVVVALSGAGIVPGSIHSNTGFYDSAKNAVVFDKSSDPSLAALGPSASGLGSLTFTAAGGGKSPQINFVVSMNGTPEGSSGASSISASLTRTAKVASAVAFTTSTSHAVGPFTNSGPIPPHAGQATTYSVLWNAGASSSDLGGVSVSATLPSYVTFTKQVSPTGAVTYDDASRTVTWNAGDLTAGHSASAAFQVSLTPSTSQKGSAPLLTSAPELTAYDRFAGADISAEGAAASTETPGDPGYSPTNADVQ